MLKLNLQYFGHLMQRNDSSEKTVMLGKIEEIGRASCRERVLLKLNLQYFGHLMRRADSLEKALMLEKIEGKRRSSSRE